MKLFQKVYIIPVIMIFVLVITGCSNPESKKEAQKLLEKQAKVLKDVKQVEKAYNKIQSVSDSLKSEQLKLIEKKDEVKHDLNELDAEDKNLNIDIKDKKQNELKEQITDLEKQLEAVNRKIMQLEQKDSILSKTKDTIYVQRQTDNNTINEEKLLAEGEKDTSSVNKENKETIRPKEQDKRDKKSEEQILEILEGKKNTKQKQQDVLEQDSGLVKAKDSKINAESLDKNAKETEALNELDNEITAKKAEIDSLKREVANEAKKLTQKQSNVKEKGTKGVSKLTKVITIIIAIALVMFIVLYLLGKQGLAKKKS